MADVSVAKESLFPPEPKFTRAYFHEEVLRLREAFGTESFWDKPGAVERSLKALGYVYLRLSDATEYDRVLWEGTTGELSRRHVILLMSGRVPLTEAPRG